ncbi:hypothetical protein OE903_12070 [Bacillus sp. B6(2022)]|nr:hypothetical protein [Bacillus sp. B6(2022)]
MSAPAPPVSEDTHIHIESLHVDKIDYHLEFGELSIDQLQGRLNIGATYYTPKDPHLKRQLQYRSQKKQKHQKSPFDQSLHLSTTGSQK